MYKSSTGKTPQEKRIEARIAVKDAREDAKQRSITVAWSINAAINRAQVNGGFVGNDEDKDALIADAKYLLRIFDRLFEERSQEQARKYEEEDIALDAAQHDAGNE